MIDERDENEEKSDDNAIYLTNGCSEAVTLVYQMLIRNSNDGIMIPIP
jgi:aspartate/methionine/tyrosine aminotransferase